MKKLVFFIAFFLSTITITAEDNDPTLSNDCYDAANRYVQTLDWNTTEEQEKALAILEFLIDMCDQQGPQ